MDLINCNNKVQDAKNHDAYAFLEKIFGSYIWELKYTSNTGLIHIERLYFDKKKFIVNKSVLSTTNNNVIKLSRCKITIHDLKIHDDIIEFYKTNIKRSYSNIYTKLYIRDSNNLIGIEGEGNVEYLKIKKNRNRFWIFLGKEF